MKDATNFINRIVILFTFVMILLIGLNLFYTDVVLKNKDLYMQHNQFLEFKENNDIKIMIFGDSLATDDFNSIYIPDSYNLATPGETLEQTQYKISWVLLNMPEVETFVLEYNRHSFNYYRINPYYDLSYWDYYMTIDELHEKTNISKVNLFFVTKIPVLGKGEEIYRYFFDPRPYVRIDNSWQNYSETFEELQGDNMAANGRERSLSQFKKYPIVREDDLSQTYLNTLTRLKSFNEVYGKKTILVIFPLTDEYLSPLEEGVNITEEYKDFDQMIMDEFNVIILDYRERWRYNTSLFVHSDHLNNKGAEIFSKTLNDDITKFLN